MLTDLRWKDNSRVENRSLQVATQYGEGKMELQCKILERAHQASLKSYTILIWIRVVHNKNQKNHRNLLAKFCIFYLDHKTFHYLAMLGQMLIT